MSDRSLPLSIETSGPYSIKREVVSMVRNRRFVFIAAQFWEVQNVKNESSHLNSFDHIRTGSENQQPLFQLQNQILS